MHKLTRSCCEYGWHCPSFTAQAKARLVTIAKVPTLDYAAESYAKGMCILTTLKVIKKQLCSQVKHWITCRVLVFFSVSPVTDVFAEVSHEFFSYRTDYFGGGCW